MNKGKYYITTAIAYTSGKPHIGNSYEIVLADCIARFKRKEGYEVFFQTGTDEHGQKIEMKAKEAGVTPREFVDGVAGVIKDLFDLMNTSYDKFIRTTDAAHERQIQKIFRKLYDQGDIYKGAYEGLYCTPCESFWTESQLKDGKCPDCGREVKAAREEAYFFKMSKYADRLIEHINTHPEFIQPVSRKNEMMNNFLLPGLQDLCVSRTSFTWGIPVDFDPKHVVYVWLDALSNYITGIGFDCDGSNTAQYGELWPADLHLIGKDIVRFHTIYWPIFLMALGEPLPKQVFGHPWLLQGEGKMSKSRGNVLYADDLTDFFGVDAVRYYVLHEMPYDNDGTISWELMVERINSDLANTLGNLVNRTVSMSNKYFGGIVTNQAANQAAGMKTNQSTETATGQAAGTAANQVTEAESDQTTAAETAAKTDADLKATVTGTLAKVTKKMDELRVADALGEIIALFRRCNKYIDETEPWLLAKDPARQDRLNTVLYHLVESILIGASLLEPFMPATAEKIAGQLQAPLRDFTTLSQFGLYQSGSRVTDHPEILFARLDIKEVLEKVEAMFSARNSGADASGNTIVGSQSADVAVGNQTATHTPDSAAPGQTPGLSAETGPTAIIDLEPKPEITYDDFARLQFQVGEIIACEEVPKSKKLLCSKVRIGSQVKQIVSGIKQHYTPEEMLGKKVMVLVNLKPATLAGVLSEGMLLCAEDSEGKLAILTPERPMPSGAEIS